MKINQTLFLAVFKFSVEPKCLRNWLRDTSFISEIAYINILYIYFLTCWTSPKGVSSGQYRFSFHTPGSEGHYENGYNSLFFEWKFANKQATSHFPYLTHFKVCFHLYQVLIKWWARLNKLRLKNPGRELKT